MSTVDSLRDWWPADRREFETRFDRVVRNNRFTISVFFPLNGAVLLIASAEGWLPDPIAFNGLLILLGVIVMRSPLIAGVIPVANRRAVAGVLLLTGYAYIIEFIGVNYGVPYGEFRYVVDLGPTVGGIPIALPVFFLPLVMNAYLLALLLLGDRAGRTGIRLGSVIALVLAMDFVLDPGAAALRFWTYPGVSGGGLRAALGGGPFYGVPLSNYAGWCLSATVAVVSLDWAFDSTALRTRLAECEFMLDDMVSFVLLWGGINVWFGHPVPVLIAVLIGAGLVWTDRFDSELLTQPVAKYRRRK